MSTFKQLKTAKEVFDKLDNAHEALLLSCTKNLSVYICLNTNGPYIEIDKQDRQAIMAIMKSRIESKLAEAKLDFIRLAKELEL